jgi:hypothetical protein
MRRFATLKLARMAALLILVCGVLVFGANRPAWATPAQNERGQTVTITPAPFPDVRLTLGQVNCSSSDVRIEFTVRQLPTTGVTSYGSVSYVVNGQTRTASFDRKGGTNARYRDTITRSQQASNNVYNITSGTVTLTISGQPVTATLENPNSFTVRCRRSSGDDDKCPRLSNDDVIGPDNEGTDGRGEWSLRVRVIKCITRGKFQLQLVGAPGPNSGDQFAGSQIEVNFLDDNGQPLSQPTFSGSMTLCFAYAGAEGAVGLTMQTFDPAQGRWVPLATSAGGGSICAVLPHLSTYAVTLRVPAQATPPSAAPGAGSPAVGGGTGAVAAPSAPRAPGVVPSALPRTGDTGAPSLWLWLALGAALSAAGLLLLSRARRAQRES